MGDKTAIEWTRGDDGTPGATWNPLVGCSKVGENDGCAHCYAINVVHRGMAPQHVGLTVKPEGGPVDWTGEIREVPSMLDRPLRWRKPRRIFVNSLSDLFHPYVRYEFIVDVFAVMALAPQHTFQILTKRPQRMAAVLNNPDFEQDVADRVYDIAVFGLHGYQLPRNMSVGLCRLQNDGQRPWATWPLRNVWLGTSIESNKYVFRANHLRNTPAAVRWISAEPLIGPLDELDLTNIDWVVAGGESGPGARPMHPDWVRDLRDRCIEPCDRPTAFFFKQHGSWVQDDTVGRTTSPTGPKVQLVFSSGAPSATERGLYMRNVGKKAAGRMLDGRTWDEMPLVPS